MLDSPWFWVHVSSLLFAYASFALAGVLGLTYMLQFKEIKKKHLGYFYTRLPSLQMLDVMNSRAMTVGWVFLTVGVVVGVRLDRAGARSSRRTTPTCRRCRSTIRRSSLSLLTWAVYSFALFARRTMGWTGRRAALAVGARLRRSCC